MERAVKKEKKKRKRGKGIKLARRKKRKEKKGKGYHAGIQNKGSGSKEQIHFCDGDKFEYFVTGDDYEYFTRGLKVVHVTSSHLLPFSIIIGKKQCLS